MTPRPKVSLARRATTAGLFIVGTDTGVGKTFVASRIAAALLRAGLKVGVYKPTASGCRRVGRAMVSDDAVALWEAAGRPGELKAVCPQRFAAPLAPHLAAKQERKRIDSRLLRRGLDYWQRRSDSVVVEGAGGLMSPIGETDYVADLASDFGFPLIIVVPNKIGAINATLLTLIAAASRSKPLPVAGIVLNDVLPPATRPIDAAQPRGAGATVRAARADRAVSQRGRFDPPVDWLSLARR